jgi:DNA-binding MarR family transcriptional regulator
MNQDTNSSRDRAELIRELTENLRSFQVAQDRINDALARTLGINRTDTRCLDIVDRHRRVTAGQLAEEAGLTTGAVTAVLDRLERAGLVRRVPDEEDRRRVWVTLTADADAVTKDLYEPVAAATREAMAAYTDAQLEVVAEFAGMARDLSVAHADWLRATNESGLGDRLGKAYTKLMAKQRKLAAAPDKLKAKLDAKQAKLAAQPDRVRAKLDAHQEKLNAKLDEHQEKIQAALDRTRERTDRLLSRDPDEGDR